VNSPGALALVLSGPGGSAEGRSKCCSGPRFAKQVLYPHRTGRPEVPSLPWSSPQGRGRLHPMHRSSRPIHRSAVHRPV
jgi:hypothetical protein